MAYRATVLPIMIASPGDVLEARQLIRDIIQEWNYVHSLSENIVLMPLAWETHASPELGGRPQELINERILKDCDLLVGLFWTRLGTPTGKAASGSVEEVEQHISAGKPAMVYFSSAPVAPASLDPDQYAALQEFKRWRQSKGLTEDYENLPDLRVKFTRQLQITLRENQYLQNHFKQSADALGAITQLRPPLSAEARELLIEAAADKSGHVLKARHMGGNYVITNGKTFGGQNARLEARWDFAVDQLVSEGLLRPTGTKGEVFRVTNEGYELADRLKAAS